MIDTYRKWGRVVRYENGVTIRVEEAGEASEQDGVFRAQPAQTRVSVPHWPVSEVDSHVAQTLLSESHTFEDSNLDGAKPLVDSQVAETLLSVPRTFEDSNLEGTKPLVDSHVAQTLFSVSHTFEDSNLGGAKSLVDSYVAQTLLSVRPLVIERLIVSAGMAQHETNGVAWTEESRRVHISLINPPQRVLIDLASFDIAIIEKVACALGRAGNERVAPSRLRLAPNVSAALLPSLIGELAMEQRGGGFDGKGQLIETRAVTSDPPPNWYRPGYAVRPIRAWLNICALPFGSIDKSAPLAVALLAPVEGTMIHVLCIDGEDVFPTRCDAGRIAAVSRDEPEWYPYAAGSFGAEMMI